MMEAFAASSAKLFLENHCLLWSHHHCSATLNSHHRRHALRFSPPRRRNILHVAAFSAPDPQVASVVGDEGVQSEDTAITTEFRNVRVKFELRRECSFGQQFLIVGDDLMLGLWDPLNAVPLNWSDGHVWALEMDVPCNKVIMYKFILKVIDGDGDGGDDIVWQPGPDRVLETWETEKTIAVCEDWDNPELQTIMEEDPVINQLSESLEDSQALKDMEGLIQLEGDSKSHLEEELQSENGYIVSDKEVIDKAATLGRSSSVAGVPVLVPGLTPLPADDTEEESVWTSEKNIATDSTLNFPEPSSKEEPAIGFPMPNEGTEKWSNYKPGLYEKGKVEVQSQVFEVKEQPGNVGVQLSRSVLKSDFDWGMRTIRQFLAKLLKPFDQ